MPSVINIREARALRKSKSFETMLGHFETKCVVSQDAPPFSVVHALPIEIDRLGQNVLPLSMSSSMQATLRVLCRPWFWQK